MSNHRYNIPSAGTLDWHVPLNENFDRLERDVEIRDLESNMSSYDPASGSKFFATDTGATYSGDGTKWNLVGYVSRAVTSGLGHYANYADGLQDEPVNSFVFGPEERLEVTRLSLPMKGLSDGSTEPGVKLRVYEGEAESNLLVEIDGNSFKSASTSDSTPWVATSSPVTVTITNSTGGPIDATPNVWANIRR